MEWGNTVWSTQLHPFQSLLIDRQTDFKKGARDQSSVPMISAYQCTLLEYPKVAPKKRDPTTMLCTVINQQGADTIQIDLHLVRIAPVGRRR